MAGLPSDSDKLANSQVVKFELSCHRTAPTIVIRLKDVRDDSGQTSLK